MRAFIANSTLVLIASLTAAAAHATMTLRALNGVASNIQYPTDTSGNALKPIVYAGMAGTCASGTVCDTCKNTVTDPTKRFFPCNHNSVSVAGKLHIELVSDTSTTYTQTDARMAGANVVTLSTVTYDSSSKVMVADIAWSDICQAINNDGTCSTVSGIQTVSIGLGAPSGGGVGVAEKFDIQVVVSKVDPTDAAIQYTENCGATGVLTGSDTYGYCYFEATRGDGKAYMTPLVAAATYPSYKGNLNYDGIEVFYAAGEKGNETAIFDSMSSASSSQTFQLATGQVALSDNRVYGLTNDQYYCFVIANRDAAGNIFYYSPPPGSSPSVGSAQTAVEMCTTPAYVSGLLDDKHCFIATATFGSDMAPEVQSFRNFRNRFLLRNSWGESVVKFYYEISPPLAEFISHHEVLRAGSRVILWPLLIFAKLSLSWGIIWTSLLFAAIVFGLAEGFRRLSPRRSRKIS